MSQAEATQAERDGGTTLRENIGGPETDIVEPEVAPMLSVNGSHAFILSGIGQSRSLRASRPVALGRFRRAFPAFPSLVVAKKRKKHSGRVVSFRKKSWIAFWTYSEKFCLSGRMSGIMCSASMRYFIHEWAALLTRLDANSTLFAVRVCPLETLRFLQR